MTYGRSLIHRDLSTSIIATVTSSKAIGKVRPDTLRTTVTNLLTILYFSPNQYPCNEKHRKQ